jgi:TolB-like protein
MLSRVVRTALPLVFLPLLAAPVVAPPRTAVAVLRFDNNTDEARYDNLGRALATMMITDLSEVEELRMVERLRLEDLQAELQLQQSGYVDPETAVTLGMMVGAEYVVTGAFLTVDPEMRLDTRIINVATTEIVRAAEVSGPIDELLDLQERLAEEFIEGLSIVLTEQERERLREQRQSNGIGDLDTALALSTALCLLDNGAYLDALDQLEEVRRSVTGSSIIRLTMNRVKDRLQGRAEKAAKSRVKEEANRRIGGLLGRRGRSSQPKEPERPPRPEGC